MINKDTFIQTYTGKAFKPFKPDIDKICIEDISHSLSLQCRFNGHCKEFYSVAQHSILVSYIIETKFQGTIQEILAALHHDSAEAYFGDVVQPLKSSIYNHDMYTYIKLLQNMIAKKFRFVVTKDTEQKIKQADLIALSTEKRDLLSICEADWQQDLPEPLQSTLAAHDWLRTKVAFIDSHNFLMKGFNG